MEISNSGLIIGVKPYTKEHKEYRKRGTVNGNLYMLDSNGNPNVPYVGI